MIKKRLSHSLVGIRKNRANFYSGFFFVLDVFSDDVESMVLADGFK